MNAFSKLKGNGAKQMPLRHAYLIVTCTYSTVYIHNHIQAVGLSDNEPGSRWNPWDAV
jgi:hypothetical protein